jgi:hypothetical protein
VGLHQRANQVGPRILAPLFNLVFEVIVQRVQSFDHIGWCRRAGQIIARVDQLVRPFLERRVELDRYAEHFRDNSDRQHVGEVLDDVELAGPLGTIEDAGRDFADTRL